MAKLKKIIGNQAHWTLNKELVRKIGLTETLVLQHLIDLQENIFEGEFYQQIDRIAEELTIGEWKVKECLKSLKEYGLIDIVKKGMPAKNYYKVYGKAVLEVISKELPLVSRKSTDLLENPQLEENQPTSEVESNSLVSRKSTDQEKKQEKELNKKETRASVIQNRAITEEVFDNTFADILK